VKLVDNVVHLALFPPVISDPTAEIPEKIANAVAELSVLESMEFEKDIPRVIDDKLISVHLLENIDIYLIDIFQIL
jgi:hypothetical protein